VKVDYEFVSGNKSAITENSEHGLKWHYGWICWVLEGDMIVSCAMFSHFSWIKH